MTDALERAWASALSAALGESVQITGRHALSGGSISRAERLETNAGVFFVKSNADPLPGLFSTEAKGLETLASSDSELVVPKPIAHAEPRDGCPAFLITEHLASGPPVGDFDARLGRGLAALHRTSHAQFGFFADNYCGATTQPNSWMSSWADFYRERRLGHQMRLAESQLSRSDIDALGRLLDRLPELLEGTEEPPALLHGDLWSGNLHVASDGRPALIDPAAYFGHREAELGMMTLFGGFSARVYDAYEEAAPLPDGWRARNPLYQLYHLLNHLNLFGGAYGAQSMAIVRRYV